MVFEVWGGDELPDELGCRILPFLVIGSENLKSNHKLKIATTVIF